MALKRTIKELANYFDQELQKKLPINILPNGILSYKNFLVKPLSNNKWGVTVVEEWNGAFIAGDTYYNSCSALLHFSGSNSSTTFIDNSPNAFSITSNNGAAISTAQSKFGGSSGYFDGISSSILLTR